MAVLKWCAYIGASLYSLHVPVGFGVRAGLQVNTSHIFPQSVLVAITLVGSGSGDEGARARDRCKLGLPYAQWPWPHYHRWGQVPSCWSRSPEGWVQADSTPFKCVISLLPVLAPLPLTLLQEQASLCVLFTSGAKASSSPPVGPTSTPKEACLPCVGPQDWGAQCVAWTAYSPGWISSHVISLFPCVPSQGHSSLTWSLLFLSYPIPCGSFLYPCLYKWLSARFWLVFSENISMCRCILDVSVWGGEFHILLFRHLDLPILDFVLLVRSPMTLNFLQKCSFDLWDSFPSNSMILRC